jgi:hypothetical protein
MNNAMYGKKALISMWRAVSATVIGIGLLAGQTAYAALPAPLPVAVTAATTADPAVARRMVLARQLLDMQGFTTDLTDVFDQLAPMVTQAMITDPNLSSLPQPDKIKFGELLIVEIKAAVPLMVDKYVAYFAMNMTEAELTELIELYQRPTMKKFQFLTAAAENSLSSEMDSIAEQAAVRAYTGYLKWKKSQ